MLSHDNGIVEGCDRILSVKLLIGVGGFGEGDWRFKGDNVMLSLFLISS
jgi:hypothetical protein